MKGLITKPKWADLILSGEKTWEIRGSATHIRGYIAIIKSGTGEVYGTVDLVESRPMKPADFHLFHEHHHVSDIRDVPYAQPHIWVLQNPERFRYPIPYKHPQGAVIWVNLKEQEVIA